MPETEVEHWRDRAKKAEGLIDATAGGEAVLVNVADLAAIGARAERAEAALERYGVHAVDCKRWKAQACSCGLGKVLKADR